MVIDPDVIKVVSFMLLMAGGFLGLLYVIDEAVQWAMDNGLFWYVVAPVGTAIWLSNLWSGG